MPAQYPKKACYTTEIDLQRYDSAPRLQRCARVDAHLGAVVRLSQAGHPLVRAHFVDAALCHDGVPRCRSARGVLGDLLQKCFLSGQGSAFSQKSDQKKI